MSNIVRKKFTSDAVSAYKNTYVTLFDQANIEADRLRKTNILLTKLEEEIFDPERLDEMDLGQKLMLMELLAKTSNSTLSNMMKFTTAFNNIRGVVGILDTLEEDTKSTEKVINPKSSRLTGRILDIDDYEE